MRSAYFFAFTLFIAASCGCSSEPVQVGRISPNLPNQNLDAGDGSMHSDSRPVLNEPVPQDIALELCQFSRGAFPNWMQYLSIIPYLAPNEASALQYMAEQLLAEIPMHDRARYLAVSEFIAQNTICSLHDSEVGRDQTGALAFSFAQQYPVVPNIPDADCRDLTDACIQKWVILLTNHWKRDYRDQQISIVLQPDSSSRHYIMRSNIDRSYALPLKIRSFWLALEQFDFDLASHHLALICQSDVEKCTNLRAHLDTDLEFARQTAALFEQQVSVDNIRFQAVSLTGNSGYVAAELSLSHHGNGHFNHIVLKTDELKPQYCELQASRSYITSDPLALPPGSQAKSWCILRKNTSPQIKFSTIIADYFE